MSVAQLRCAWHIAAKDMRTYYLKPPLISWGMLFPLVMILSFYIRSPGDISSLAPGLVGMTVLFGATSVEAVAISFEKRIGAMERLVMAPIAPYTLLIGKTASGAVFGMTAGTIAWLATSAAFGLPLAGGLPLLVIFLGSLAFALLGVLLSLAVGEVFEAMTLANFFRFPMIFLGGVFIPVTAMAPLVRGVASALPLTYMVDALRHLILGGEGAYYSLTLDLAAGVGFALLFYICSLRLLEGRLEDMIS